MQIWSREEEPAWEEGHRICCSPSAVDDARRVADKLGIPPLCNQPEGSLPRENCRLFHRRVCGADPKPCIACNHYIKFAALLDRALALGPIWLPVTMPGGYSPERVVTYSERKGSGTRIRVMSLRFDPGAALPYPACPGEQQGGNPAHGPGFGLKGCHETRQPGDLFCTNNDYRSFLRRGSLTRSNPVPSWTPKGMSSVPIPVYLIIPLASAGVGIDGSGAIVCGRYRQGA